MDKIKIGITHGDINGIGYEIIFKTLQDSRMHDLFVPIIYGSSKAAAYHRKMLDMNISLNQISDAKEASDKRTNIINCCDDEVKVEVGLSTPIAGEASFKALKRATDDLKEGLIDAIVTAPINKHNIQSKDFSFPGHTEYLETNFGNKGEALMLLATSSMRIAVATGHVALKDVSANLTKDGIISKLRIFNQSLTQDFGIQKPRIAVLALNPHASDGGVIGTEEQECIIPAIKEAFSEGIMCFGPYPADGFFGSLEYKKFDGILAMYHDQGLIPFKLLAMESGVNFTAGLNVVRTSPDHGTAYDIAGKNKASEESIREAIYMAIDIVNNRKQKF